MHGDVAVETHAHEKIESLTRELALRRSMGLY